MPNDQPIGDAGLSLSGKAPSPAAQLRKPRKTYSARGLSGVPGDP
jgi:hypothetical protein